MKTGMLKVIFSLLCFVAAAITVFAQEAIVFKTYKDFENKQGDKYDGYHKYHVNLNWPTLVFLKGDEKVIIKSEEIWGFVIGEAFFRICLEDRVPVRLISMGKIQYFENGFAHLDMLRKESSSAEVKAGEAFYVAQDMKHPVMALDMRGYIKKKGPIHSLVMANPHYKALFDCFVKSRGTSEGNRKCVNTFEKK